MQCMSCNSEINPKCKHAIQSNMCPFCGESIMHEDLKNGFSILQELMLKLEPYNQQLEDWMLSNFNFIRTTSPLIVNYVPVDFLKKPKKTEPVDNQKFIVKVPTENGEEEVVAEKIQSEDRTNLFFKNAQVVKPRLDGFNSVSEKTQKLKSMVQQIRSGGSQSIALDENADIINSEQFSNSEADPETVANLQAALEEDDANIYASVQADDNDEIPNSIMAMASKAQGNNSQADLLKLKELQDRVANSRKNFQTGGKGSFSRM